MFSLLRFLALLVACSVADPARAGFLDYLLPRRDVQAITVTDTTPSGALLRPASPANPVYYTAVNAGYRDFGGIVAGEKIPPKEMVLQTIARVLAKHGYLPATTERAPTLLLIWTWGTLNTDRHYNPFSDDTEGQQVNRQQMLRFMGAYKLGLVTKERTGFQSDMMLPGLFSLDADAEMISDAATDDLFIAAISAYDHGAATRKEKVLLWTTKISCPSRGLSLAETLPAMLAIAGPHIGRETAKPVWIKASDKFKPEVKIGEAIVVEDVPGTKLPVFELPPQAAKKQTVPEAAPKQKKR